MATTFVFSGGLSIAELVFPCPVVDDQGGVESPELTECNPAHATSGSRHCCVGSGYGSEAKSFIGFVILFCPVL